MLANDVLKKIRRIEIVSTRLVETVLSGNYLSTFHGTGLEFSEVREYAPDIIQVVVDFRVWAEK